MNRIEVRKNNLAMCLLVMGVVRVPEEQKLLLAPKKEKKRSNLDFDPNLEAGYLARLPVEMRRGQLKKEVQTSLSELYLNQVGHTYVIENKRLVDSETKLDVEKLTALGEVPEEVKGIQKIIQLMVGGKADLVVSISQKNKDLSYPDNMVDMWMRCADGKIRVLRSKITGDEETFKNFYKNIGGKKTNPNKREMLSDPVEIENLRLGEVLNMLVIEKCEANFGEKEIGALTEHLVKSFENRFKDRLTRDPNTILRFYLAVKDAVKNLGKEKLTAERMGGIIDSLSQERYLSGQIKVRIEKGGGCGTSSLGGEFAKQGWVLTFKDGKLSSYFGSTEGLSYCERCGCWHKGSKCPYCDKS